LVERLDIPRRQVYVEGLIIETTINKADDFGVEWVTLKESGDTLFSGGFQGDNIGRYQGLGTQGSATDGSGTTQGGFYLVDFL